MKPPFIALASRSVHPEPEESRRVWRFTVRAQGKPWLSRKKGTLPPCHCPMTSKGESVGPPLRMTPVAHEFGPTIS